jgi:hypothetical protein
MHNQLIHPVKQSYKGGLTAAGRPDQSSNLIGVNIYTYVLQGLMLAVKETYALRPHFYISIHIEPSVSA